MLLETCDVLLRTDARTEVVRYVTKYFNYGFGGGVDLARYITYPYKV